MLLTGSYLDKSPIQGIGVFSRRFIAKDTRIWKLDLRFDRLIEVDAWEAQTGPVKDYLDRYAYPRRSDPKYIVFEADDARYMNHDDDPNCDFSHGDVAHALRDIKAGEELTLRLQRLLHRRLRVPGGPVSGRRGHRTKFGHCRPPRGIVA
jgi:SET domain-containing protein